MAKTVKIEGTFEVLNASSTIEAKKVTKIEEQHPCAVQHFPAKIAASQTNAELPLGGVARAKKVFIRTDYEVTLKFNQQTDTGFPFGPGDGYFSSQSGITAVFLNTGANETTVELIAVGDAPSP